MLKIHYSGAHKMYLTTNQNNAKLEPRSAKLPLRWAGGKAWLTRNFEELFPSIEWKNYYEPFLGGGAIFFHLKPESAFLSDTNADLVETYAVLRDDPHAVIRQLKRLKNTETEYYRIRASRPRTPANKAARFIFLNRTSFNGIYRVNLNGQYNVPYGGVGKRHVDEIALLTASNSLRNAQIRTCDFASSIMDVERGDLVFLDPPYTVSHNKNGFIKYNEHLFQLSDQYRLADAVNTIRERGASYILTNANHKKIRKIFENGDHIFPVSRSNLIGGKEASRGKTTELIITNLEPNL